MAISTWFPKLPPNEAYLYVGSMEATGQSVGEQTSGERHFLKPSYLTSELPPRAIPGLQPACQIYYKEQAPW